MAVGWSQEPGEDRRGSSTPLARFTCMNVMGPASPAGSMRLGLAQTQAGMGEAMAAAKAANQPEAVAQRADDERAAAEVLAEAPDEPH